jgi:hypothetical protein
MNYERIYNCLIEKRQKYPLIKKQSYCEAHHIVPISINPTLKNEKTNIVNLSAREHYLAHKLLVNICKSKFGLNSKEHCSMLSALWFLTHKFNNGYTVKISSRTFQTLKEEYSKMLSETKSGKNHWNWGKHLSEETKRKIGNANAKNKWSDERKINFSKLIQGENNPNYGNFWTDEQRKNASLKKVGTKLSDETKQKLSQMFSGKNNPMYRKSSWEKCTDEERTDRIKRWQESMSKYDKATTKGAKWMRNDELNQSVLVLPDKIIEYQNMRLLFW